jgi:N,N-dimethylformamidase
VRPHYPNWLTGSFRHFAVDLLFLALHARGSELLSKYKVVVTGSHPEYWTSKALAALENYALGDGRILYLGGNGFYWVTSIDPDRPWIVEVRRRNSGVRAWDAPPGERNHVHTGEPGGLWRYRGRGPNMLVGVGFATEGFSKGKGYKRAPASYEPRFKAFFDGVSEDVIGEEGYILGGAASDECDRYDLALGSPAQATILASATGFGPEYLMVPEDLHTPMPNSMVRTVPTRCEPTWSTCRSREAAKLSPLAPLDSSAPWPGMASKTALRDSSTMCSRSSSRERARRGQKSRLNHRWNRIREGPLSTRWSRKGVAA